MSGNPRHLRMRDRLAVYAALRDQGLSPAAAATGMELSQSSGQRYERWYRIYKGWPARKASDQPPWRWFR